MGWGTLIGIGASAVAYYAVKALFGKDEKKVQPINCVPFTHTYNRDLYEYNDFDYHHDEEDQIDENNSYDEYYDEEQYYESDDIDEEYDDESELSSDNYEENYGKR